MLNLNKTLKKGAVTGGISSGKSTVCRYFQELGAHVVSADEIVHQLLLMDKKIIQEVISLLGIDILSDNRIDRAKVAKKVFNQPSLLNSLEGILHPAVQKEIKKQYELKNKEAKTALFIAEIPLLFETESKKDFDFTIAVLSDTKVCEDRFHLSTGYEKEEFHKRKQRQLDNLTKSNLADYVIFNNGSLNDLRDEVTKLYKELTTT